jgi:hypothetical protein
MKTIIILTILGASALTFLSSCRTGRWSSPPPGRTKMMPQVLPRPYYLSNGEGSYYYSRGDAEETNRDYRPVVRRNIR